MHRTSALQQAAAAAAVAAEQARAAMQPACMPLNRLTCGSYTSTALWAA